MNVVIVYKSAIIKVYIYLTNIPAVEPLLWAVAPASPALSNIPIHINQEDQGFPEVTLVWEEKKKQEKKKPRKKKQEKKKQKKKTQKTR